MNPRVHTATPLPNYQLALTFTNGEAGTYDCRHLLGLGVFRRLQDEAYFRRVRAADGTVVWPDEQDICPDTLYLASVRTTHVEQTTPHR